MPELKTKPAYKIFILDEDEFNGLDRYYPVNKKDLEEGLGFSYQKTRECFVKRTGVKEIDDETVLHEAQELLAKHSDDEDENNIRWKKGGQIIRNVVSAVAVITGHPYVAAAMQLGHGAYEQSKGRQTLGQTLLGTGGALLGGALGAGNVGGTAYTAARTAGQSIPQALGHSVVQGGKSLLGMTPSGVGFGASYPAGTPVGITNMGTYSQFPGGSVAGLVAAPLSTAGQVVPVGGSVGTLAPILGQLQGPVTASQAAQGLTKLPTPGAGAGGTPSGLEKVAGTLGKSQTLLGAGSLLAAQAPKQPVFEMPSSVNEIRGKLMSGEALSPLGEQARTELSTILKSQPQELYPTANDAYYQATLRRTRENYAEAGRQLDAAYNVAGVYGSGEHLAQKAKLQEDLARTESAISAEIEQKRFELARTAKYEAVRDALNVDRDTMDDIVGLTGLDVQTAAMVYGAKVQDVQAIRESLGTLGVELLLRGQRINRAQGGININLGGTSV